MITDNKTNDRLDNLCFEELMDSIASTLGDNMVVRGLGMLSKYDILNNAICDEDVINSYSEMAEKGFPKAMYQLGECYAKGIGGVQQELDTAFNWYVKAAKLNHRDAQRTVATMYRYGVAVLKNTSKYVEWITKAAEKDDLLAMLKLADYYWYQHYETPQLKYEAYNLYTNVVYKIHDFGLSRDSIVVNHIINQADRLNGAAQYGLGIMYEYGIIFPKDEEQAHDSYMSTTDMFLQANCIANGLGCKINNEHAVKWFTYAAKAGDPRAQIKLGNCCLSGLLGLPQNYDKALEWYRKALVELNELTGYLYEELMEKLVYMAQKYMEGCDDIQQNYPQAIKCLTIAAEKNWPKAQYLLGECYANGSGVTENYKKAVELYLEAADHGCEDAQWALCVCYMEGECGLDVNYAEAYKWCNKLCDKDDMHLRNSKSYEDIKNSFDQGIITGFEMRNEVLGFLHRWHDAQFYK